MASYKSDLERPHKTKAFRDRSGDEEMKALFLEKLEENHGDLYNTYSSLGIKYNRFYEWRKTDPDFDAAIDRIKLDQVRWIEGLMFKKIEEGDKDLMKFYLKTHKYGQQSGYVETKKIEAEVKQAIDIEKQLEEMAANLEDDPFAE